MTLDEILVSLFPTGHHVAQRGALLLGNGALDAATAADIIGVTQGQMLGVEDALILARQVLGLINAGIKRPLLVLVDSSSQRMSRHDELMGLNEYLAHLAKTLLLANAEGHRTIGLLYGGSAAGAFIATALACETLLALPGAQPAVMDLPSIARVTKLPLARLQEMAKATPVFAPGLDNLAQMGAIDATLDPGMSLAAQVLPILAQAGGADRRGARGADRGGRVKAAAIAARVQRLASV